MSISLEDSNMMLVSIGLATMVITVTVTLLTYKKTASSQAYTNVDQLYNDSLETGIDHPEFRNPEYTGNYLQLTDKNERLKYESYAYLIWNLIETVYDDNQNIDTWKPMIETEVKIHKKWYLQEENQKKFKQLFRDEFKRDYEYLLKDNSEN